MILKERLRHTLTSLSSKFYRWLLGREIFLKLLKKRHDKDMEYRVKKHFIIRPIETFLTRSYPGITSEQELMLATKRYYNFSKVDEFKLMAEFMSIYRNVSGMKDLVKIIVEEHYHMTKNVDQNLHYLWHLYNHGTKAGEYRPFILLAEIQLLKALDYITEDEAHNMSNMMQSEDTDNLNLVYLSILNMRKKRIEKHGEWGIGPASVRLSEIVKDYPHTVLSKELFIATFNK